jgi:hypothetical protein
MITFKCTKASCENKDIEYFFLGEEETAECGGCHTLLKGKDKRPDPVIEEVTVNGVTD